MSGIPSISIVEPSANERKRQFSRTLIGKGGLPDLEAIKSRLRELREYSLREHASLLEEFKDNITRYPGIQFKYYRNHTVYDRLCYDVLCHGHT